MGLAASNIRLLTLERRNSDITNQIEHLSTQKMAMSREAAKLSTDYTNSFNKKQLKLSYNGGATYLDMSYSNLMSPNVANSNKPMLITDFDGKIVISDNYLEYAKMISADGAPNDGGWASARTQVLMDLIPGLTEEQLNDYTNECTGKETSGTNTLTAEQKSLIQFYDITFKSIEQNGWTYNSKVSDDDYLNDSLQNGFFYLATYQVEKLDDGGYKISYDTDYATNNSNVYALNNSAKNEEELALYNAKKAKINAKETLIDTKMKSLETELSANKERMESIKNTMQENIERTMNLFA